MTPPGWYPDPWSPLQQRYWDGNAWTGHTAPATSRSAPLDEEVTAARRLRLIIPIGVPLQLLGMLTTVFVFQDFFDQIVDLFREIDANPTRQFDVSETIVPSPWFWVAQFASMAALVVTIMTAVWLSQSTKVAAALGLRQRWSEGWAYLGFLVPIMSFFVPYQMVVDLLGRGDPSRRQCGLWWTLFLTRGIGFLFAIFAAMFASSPAAAVMMVFASVPFVVEAALLRSMVLVTVTRHAELLGRSDVDLRDGLDELLSGGV